MTTKMFKIVDTPHFMVLAADAVAKRYNRQLDLNKLAEIIDPAGNHVLSFSMIHEHIAGKKVKPHMRTMWMLKVKNTMEFERVTLDISMENFKNIKEFPPIRTSKATI